MKAQAREERKGEEGLCKRGRLVHDGRPTKEPPTSINQSTSHNVLRNLQLSASCDNNALVLVDQVGLRCCFKSMDLTQVYCYRCNATTAVPATTSMFNDDDRTVVLDVGGGRPQSSAQVTCTFMSVRLAPRYDRQSGVKRRTAWQTARKPTMMTTAAF